MLDYIKKVSVLGHFSHINIDMSTAKVTVPSDKAKLNFAKLGGIS